MIFLKTKEEIEVLREGGRRLARILKEVSAAARPGVSTLALDGLAESLIFDSGGTPAFKGYRIKGVSVPYPATLCVSLNDEVVHGIPRPDRILQDGDIVGIDIGMRWPRKELGTWNLELGRSSQAPSSELQGPLITDMAVTIGVGAISSEAGRLIRMTKEGLVIGIGMVKPGAHVGDIGCAVEQHLEGAGLGIIRDLAGHGVGYELHEEPLIPNYGKPGIGPEFREGMVIAIEPMATLGDWRVALAADQWTFKTRDGSLAAHFEHTLAVTPQGATVLTSE